MSLLPVYPARHPEFYAVCTNCKKSKNSADLYSDPEGEAYKAYLCVNCVFTFGLMSSAVMQKLEIERDRRELKVYGSLFGKQS